MNNKLYLLALNRMKQVGPRTVLKLLNHWPDLSSLFQTSQKELESIGLSAKLATMISEFNLECIETDLKWENKPDHHLITLEDSQYPALLKEIHDPPPVLYAKGNLSCLNQPMLAMVGTRKPTPIGQETARAFAKDLAQQDVTVVSGLALGIDAFAHLGALDADGQTIAVMATGVDRIYPYRHQTLAKNIMDKGLILNEFPLGTTPVPGHFPRRNRIISGLSLATMVVEAAIKSGSLITARYALEQNRDVLAVPGSIHNPLAKGCHHLLQQGARLVSSVEEIMPELGLYHDRAQHDEPKRPIAKDTQNLVECIGFEATTIDQIISRCGMSMDKVTCHLADLEMQGVIKAVAGGYLRCTI